LQAVAADFTRRGNGESAGNRIFDLSNNQPRAQFFGAMVAKFVEFGEMMAGVHVHQGHGNIRGTKCFFRQTQQTDGILAAGEQEGRALKFRGDFTHHVYRFRFQKLQMIQMIVHFLKKIWLSNTRTGRHDRIGAPGGVQAALPFFI